MVVINGQPSSTRIRILTNGTKPILACQDFIVLFDSKTITSQLSFKVIKLLSIWILLSPSAVMTSNLLTIALIVS